MNTEQMKELRELAEKASPGEWKRDEIDWTFSQVIACGNEVIVYHGKHNRQVDANVVPNMRFIAVANPKNTIALLDHVEGLEKRVKDLQELAATAYQHDEPKSVLYVNAARMGFYVDEPLQPETKP